MKHTASFAIAFFLTGLLSAQSTARLSSLRFSVVDATTGRAVQPDKFLLCQNDRVVYSLNDRIFPQQQAFPPGLYECRITAPGYSALQSRLLVAPNQPSAYQVNLDPLFPDSRVSAGYIASKRTVGQAFINGFITNENGLPVASAQIVAGRVAAFSAADGYFEICLPANETEPEATDLHISHPDYADYRQTGLMLWPGGDWQLRVVLKQQAATTGNAANAWTGPFLPALAERFRVDSLFVDEPEAAQTVCLPNSIVVGFSDTGGSCCPGGAAGFPPCTTSQVFSIETYIKHVLPNEWLASWNQPAAFQAAAVAIRSYAVYKVNHPTYGGSYDICSSPCCQNYGNTNTVTSAAVDATAAYVLFSSAGEPASAEYSAENNHLLPVCAGSTSGMGCTDGQFFWQGKCYTDSVGVGKRLFGHGRGMSQRGSARWSSGRNINSCSNTILSTQHGYGVKDWQQILALYYPTLSLVRCAPNDACNQAAALFPADSCQPVFASLTGATSSGLPVPVCSGFAGPNPQPADIWFKFTAEQPSCSVTVDPEGNVFNNTYLDPVIALYRGCTAADLLQCEDDPGGGGGNCSMTLVNLVVGQTYYLRVYHYGNNKPAFTGFTICLQKEQAVQTVQPEDNLNSFQLYPNPAGNTITITSVTGGKRLGIYNAIGQCVRMLTDPQPVEQLDLTGLPVGWYRIQFQSGTGVFSQLFLHTDK